ncbi:hypothetical protein PV10_09186, partial [Exophiala mesophila]
MAESKADAHASVSDGDTYSRDHTPARGQTAAMSMNRILTELSTLMPQTQFHDHRQQLDFDLDADSTWHRGTLRQLSTTETNKARSLFLTLHVLFPHHLLPALDLLDRSLLTRLLYGAQEVADGVSEGQQMTPGLDQASDVFYVQSSSALSGTGRKTAAINRTAVYYEVRLDSWNCTCPAFAVDVASGLMRMDHGHGHNAVNEENYVRDKGQARYMVEPWRFGGALTLLASDYMTNDGEHDTRVDSGHGVGVPVCKHILAAALARAAPALFGASVAERHATKKELAGWGGGWGELGGHC